MTRNRQLPYLLATAVVAFGLGGVSAKYCRSVRARVASHINRRDDATTTAWGGQFQLVQIQSSLDGNLQSAYFSGARSEAAKPLLVSLHTWSADYSQDDPLAPLACAEGWNYIHPDFRGPNWSPDACLSDTVLADIDDAVQYAIDNGRVDTESMFIVGVSGGGHATLGAYLRTRHKIKAFLSWVPISDLSAWFHQSKNRNAKYAQDILQCISDGTGFDESAARQRSPLFWEMPTTPKGKLEIFAGIRDGHTGSVPISHSILFFNRLATHYGSSENCVEGPDMVKLLTRAVQRAEQPEMIDDRAVLYAKHTPEVSLTIFDGAHEMLPAYCFERLKEIADPGAAPDEENRENSWPLANAKNPPDCD